MVWPLMPVWFFHWTMRRLEQQRLNYVCFFFHITLKTCYKLLLGCKRNAAETLVEEASTLAAPRKRWGQLGGICSLGPQPHSGGGGTAAPGVGPSHFFQNSFPRSSTSSFVLDSLLIVTCLLWNAAYGPAFLVQGRSWCQDSSQKLRFKVAARWWYGKCWWKIFDGQRNQEAH